jgi:hypothetical protein
VSNTGQGSLYEPQTAPYREHFEPDPALFDPATLAELFGAFQQEDQSGSETYGSAQPNFNFDQPDQ